MKSVKSERLELLANVASQLCDKQALKKIVLSKPVQTDVLKSVISPVMLSGEYSLQIETFSKDNKAFHHNLRENFEKELLSIFYDYSQINLISTLGECQFMRSKGGKESLIGEKKLINKLSGANVEKAELSGNNKEKSYILSGKEDFLKKLGISDETGRIRDKMQAKYRQINKFLEHIESIRDRLPENNINIYDLCCGKSYLSFAVYHYFKHILKKNIKMVCIDLKKDVIEYCNQVATRLDFVEMEFICMDINKYEMKDKPHLVISLHACDIATDIVLDKASTNGAEVILSTPCCHHELNHSLNCPVLDFVARHSMLRQKMCDALTDSLRLMNFLIAGNLTSRVEDTTSKVRRMTMGIIACDTGILVSVMGRDAISDTKRVVIRSDISSSPICLLPIRRIADSKTTYIIIVLTNIVVIF